MASENRKKIQLYIYPDQKPQDSYAAQYYDDMPAGLRTQAYRNALISGAALARIDPRLPDLLAMSLSTDPSGEELRSIVRGFLIATGSDIAEPGVNITPPATAPAPATPSEADKPKLNPDELNELGNNFAV